MEPMDYTSAFANLATPGDAMMGGIKNGVALQQLQIERQQAEAKRAQEAQLKVDLAALAQNPSSQAIGQMSIKYPQLSEQFKRSFDILEPAQKQAKLDHAAQVYAALHNNQPDIARDVLTKQAAALRNSGNEADAKAAETMAGLIEQNPDFAKTSAGLILSSAMGADKFASTFQALGGEERAAAKAPAELEKAQADARKAKADATVAEGTIPALIQKPTEENLSAAAKRRIDEFNAQINAADSETKRGQLTLERDKFIADQSFKALDKGEAAQGQVDSAQHALNTIASLRADPLMKDTAGNWFAGMGTVLGQVLGNIPGTENKDFRGQLESLKSQIFLPAVQQIKGMGALSNAEGEKLTAAVAALDANMSPKAFNNAMGVVERYMTKGLQAGLAKKGVPVQGGGFVTNHPTFGPVREGDINRLMKQYPGATREQVMTYLSQTGAK